MPFDSFCNKCREILRKSGENQTTVRFRNEDGKYFADFSNGVKIMGNSMSLSVRVMWGSGHKAMARI